MSSNQLDIILANPKGDAVCCFAINNRSTKLYSYTTRQEIVKYRTPSEVGNLHGVFGITIKIASNVEKYDGEVLSINEVS